MTTLRHARPEPLCLWAVLSFARASVESAPRIPISNESALGVLAALHGIANPENWTPKTEKVLGRPELKKVVMSEE